MLKEREYNQTDTFHLLYRNEKGKLFQGDSIEWLKSLESESTDLIFADPPYNIKKTEWDKFESFVGLVEARNPTSRHSLIRFAICWVSCLNPTYY